jgi:hypothetical protein
MWSRVYDHGSVLLRQYEITENKYGIGQGTGTIQYRGSDTIFLKEDVSPSWTTYTGVFSATWRYIQIRGLK